jgi:hypothetical protein
MVQTAQRAQQEGQLAAAANEFNRQLNEEWNNATAQIQYLQPDDQRRTLDALRQRQLEATNRFNETIRQRQIEQARETAMVMSAPMFAAQLAADAGLPQEYATVLLNTHPRQMADQIPILRFAYERELAAQQAAQQNHGEQYNQYMQQQGMNLVPNVGYVNAYTPSPQQMSNMEPGSRQHLEAILNQQVPN